MLDATGLVPALPGARRGGATAALDASLLRSQATASMQFVPQAVVGGGWQSASPYAMSASKRAIASGTVSRAGNGGGGGSAGSTPRVTGCLDGAGSSAAVAAAATPRADPSPLSYGVPPPSARVQAALELGKAVAAAAKLGGRLESRQIEISQIEISADLDESDGSAADEKKLREQKLALAAAVASKEATIALNRALSRAQRGTPGPNGQTPLPTNGAVAGDAPPAAPPSTAPLSSSRASELQTPVHRAPAAFRSGAVLGGGGGRSAAAPSVSTANASSDMATLGSAQYSATNGHRAQYSAGSARPANAQYSAFVKTKAGQDKYSDRAMQTLNSASKNKDAQATPAPTASIGVDATNYEIHDAIEALKAGDDLAAFGLPATVADARFAKPVDSALVQKLAAEHDVLITVEEGSIGGFGSQVMQILSDEGLLDSGALKFRAMILPDEYLEHDKPERMYAKAGLDAKGIVARVMETLGRQDELPKPMRA
jgi:hypothetical protein